MADPQMSFRIATLPLNDFRVGLSYHQIFGTEDTHFLITIQEC